MKANPNWVIKASIILAAKIEEVNFENEKEKIYSLLKIHKEEQKKLTSYESRILKSLHFKLYFIPFDQLISFLLETY